MAGRAHNLGAGCNLHKAAPVRGCAAHGLGDAGEEEEGTRTQEPLSLPGRPSKKGSPSLQAPWPWKPLTSGPRSHADAHAAESGRCESRVPAAHHDQGCCGGSQPAGASHSRVCAPGVAGWGGSGTRAQPARHGGRSGPPRIRVCSLPPEDKQKSVPARMSPVTQVQTVTPLVPRGDRGGPHSLCGRQGWPANTHTTGLRTWPQCVAVWPERVHLSQVDKAQPGNDALSRKLRRSHKQRGNLKQ